MFVLAQVAFGPRTEWAAMGGRKPDFPLSSSSQLPQSEPWTPSLLLHLPSSSSPAFYPFSLPSPSSPRSLTYGCSSTAKPTEMTTFLWLTVFVLHLKNLNFMLHDHIGPRCVHLSVRFMWTGDLRTPCGYFFFTNLQQTSKQTQGWTDAIYNGQRFKVTVTSHKKKTKKTFLRSVKSLRSAKTLFWCRNAPKEVKTVLYTEFVPSLKLWINLATDLWS